MGAARQRHLNKVDLRPERVIFARNVDFAFRRVACRSADGQWPVR